MSGSRGVATRTDQPCNRERGYVRREKVPRPFESPPEGTVVCFLRAVRTIQESNGNEITRKIAAITRPRRSLLWDAIAIRISTTAKMDPE